MTERGEINYTTKQTAVKNAAEEVTRALNTISDIFKNFQDDYLALLLDNENLRNLLKRKFPPSSQEIANILKQSPKKKKSPPSSPKCSRANSPPAVPRTIPSPIILSSQEDPETPGIVETTQFPIKPRPTPSKFQRTLQHKKSLFLSPSTTSKLNDTIQAGPSTAQTPKKPQSQSRVLALSKKNVSTRINSSGKVEKQMKLVFQPLPITKTNINSMKYDFNTTNIKDLDLKDFETDDTMFEKAFTEEERVEVIESSPNDNNLRRKGRLRLRNRPESKVQQQPKIYTDEIVLSDFECDDMEPSFTQLEQRAVTQNKIKEKNMEKGNKESDRIVSLAPHSPVLVENVNFMNFQETRGDMDETYFPRGEIFAKGKKGKDNGDNVTNRKFSDEGPSGVLKPSDRIFDMDIDGDWDTDVFRDKWTPSPPSKKQLMNSFDMIPEKKKTSPNFAFKGAVVRGKSERAKLKGWACKDCQLYYENMNLTEEELRKRMDQCSRHRSKYNERYNTPPGFWNPGFDNTPPSQ